jgi:hypothetical protein
MPTKEALGLDDREDLQDRRKPAIKQVKEPAIIVRKPDATRGPAPQDIQLCRSTAFSASSRNFDLNGEASVTKTKQSSPIIPSA